jgi:predicted dehydrogenase
MAGGHDEGKGNSVLTHAGAYRQRGDVVIAACVDPDDARRTAFADYWSVQHAFRSLEEVAASGEAFDVASLCSPTPHHAHDLELLLTMPVAAVMAEKPLTTSAADGRRLVAAYRRANKPLGVHYLRRWDPEMRRLRDELAAGAVGAVQSVTATYCQGLLHGGSHFIDLMRFLLGELEPAAVFRRRDCGRPGDPTVDGLLWLGNGAPVFLVGHDETLFVHGEITILGTAGAAVIDQSGFTIRRRQIEDHPHYAGFRRLARGEWQATALEQALVHAIDDLITAARSGAPMACTGEDGLRAQEICATLAAMPVSAPPAGR